MAYLVSINGLDVGLVLELQDGCNSIGRQPDCQVFLQLDSVSRHHAVIRIDGEQAQLEDLSSRNGTLVNALVYWGINLSDTGGEFRPGIVHRLDKDTSGVILIAKNNRVHRHLSNQLKERSTIKRYLTLVWGVPDPPSAVIDAPIGRHPVSRKKMTVISTGRPSVTSFHTIKSSNGFSLLDVKPSTGRTHQIRVHMAYNHTPIVGDQVYAPNRPRLVPRQFLHASSIQFIHPSMNSVMEISAPLPHDLENALKELLNE